MRGVGISGAKVRIVLSASPVSQTFRLASRCGRLPLSALSVLLPVLLSLALPAIAWADIYKWTDESGGTVYSNARPGKSARAKDVEVVLEEPKSTPKSTSNPERAAPRTEQALLARIESLERQLDARQYAAQAPQAPPPMVYSGYSPPAPPPSSYYTGGYDWGSNYPGYYPAYSYYPFASSYLVYPRRVFAGRPIHAAPHGGSFHGRGGHAGGGHSGRR